MPVMVFNCLHPGKHVFNCLQPGKKGFRCNFKRPFIQWAHCPIHNDTRNLYLILNLKIVQFWHFFGAEMLKSLFKTTIKSNRLLMHALSNTAFKGTVVICESDIPLYKWRVKWTNVYNSVISFWPPPLLIR